jgi:type II secretory pathway component GspD/PulD (secretin)
MKPITTLILAASLSAAASLIAAQEEAAKEEATPPASAKTDASGKLLQMNFRDASLEQVLNYLSEAAGFIINVKPGTSIRGKVTVMSSEPLTKEEAVGLLNTVLNENNLAALERGRILTIMPRDEIKIAGIPVMSGSDPDKIPITDRIVTQIMPVRFVEAAQLLKDLQPLVSIQTTMTANEAGNEILMTDTQANIHKVAEIIKAIDAGAEDFSMLKVFSLTNADPTEMADMLTQLFADDSNQRGGNQSGFSNPFFGRFGRLASLSGRGGGQSSQGSNSQNQRIKKRNRVVAYADQRTASVVVSASRDLMDEIEDVVHTLDDNRKGKKTVSMFDISGTDPAEIYPVLQELFQKYQTSSSSRNAAGSTSALSTRSSQGSSQTGSTGSSSSRTGMGQSSRGLGSGGSGGLSFP